MEWLIATPFPNCLKRSIFLFAERTQAQIALNWFCCQFKHLSNEQMYAILSIRQQVFIVEQDVQCLDADGLDIDAWHIFSQSKDGEIMAYARLLAPHTRHLEPSIGRVLVRKSARGGGIGRQLLSFCLEKCNEIYPEHAVCISAQAHLEKFYQYFGFKAVGEAYDEGGISHRTMIKAEAEKSS